MTEAARPREELSPKQYAERLARRIDRDFAYSGPGIRHDVARVQIDFITINNTGRNQRAIRFRFLIGPQQDCDLVMIMEEIVKDPDGYTRSKLEELGFAVVEARNNNIETKRRRESSIILPDDAGRFIA